MSIALRMQQAASGSNAGGVISNAWNISAAVYNADLPRFYVGSQEILPTGIHFKPDGTKMYIVGLNNDRVYEYNLSIPWSVSTASYVQFFSVSAQEGAPQDIFFHPDGIKMYIIGSGQDRVYEYNLSTAWNISTASYLQLFSVATQETLPQALFFKPDGTKMYVIGATGDDVNEYNLSTAWNISTASYVQVKSISAQESIPQGLFFKPDGTKMYVMGSSGDDVNEYNLSTPWNVSSATYVQVYSVQVQETAPTGLFFKPDGTKMYMVGNSSAGRSVFEYTLSTPWNVATAAWITPNTKYFSVVNQDPSASDIFFKPDGTKMYMVGQYYDNVYEYNLSTPWSVASASYFQPRSISAQETAAQALFFNPDGTRMYIVGIFNYAIYQYNLSTAWNISTASYQNNISLSARDTSPMGLFFKSDGTKMYFIGGNTYSIYEYTLSVPWEIIYSSYTQSFSVSAQETLPTGIHFKSDGTKMYITGHQFSNKITEYNLSTAWNISTASYLQANTSFANQGTIPQGLFFKPDGTRMYFISAEGDAVYEYDL